MLGYFQDFSFGYQFVTVLFIMYKEIITEYEMNKYVLFALLALESTELYAAVH